MKLKSIKIMILALASLVSVAAFSTTPVFADDVCNSSASAEVKRAAGCGGSSDNLPSVVQNILNSIIGVIGIVAVVFIIIGGINYMTSAGDAGKVKKARETILYASIGLIVCALAFAIVNFVIIGILKQ